jgi:hypothetical protein
MALTTTIGGATSDSYATAAEYTARAAAMGWTLGATQETDMRRACAALDSLWLYRALGYRQYQAQAREFPRVIADLVQGWPVAIDTIPQAVKDAQMELAYLIQGGADPWATVDAIVASKRVKAGPVESETVYQGGKGRASYTGVVALVQPYLGAGAGQVQLRRA